MKTTIEEPNENIIFIHEMKFHDIGVVLSGKYKHHWIMKAPDSNNIIDLTLFGTGGQWVFDPLVKVRLLNKGEKVTITFEGE